MENVARTITDWDGPYMLSINVQRKNQHAHPSTCVGRNSDLMALSPVQGLQFLITITVTLPLPLG